MVFLVSLLVLSLFSFSNSQGPPSPGYYSSSRVGSLHFSQSFRNLWGSGFKSLRDYRSDYFGTSVKLQPGYTAGIITSFYLSNSEDFLGHHHEIDIEFLATMQGKPYVLQTNFHLWFDPTKGFHNYAILWNPNEIIFFMDDVPIRRYPKKSDATFPQRPMYVYGSIWYASSWATEDGRNCMIMCKIINLLNRIFNRYQPFVGKYNNFKIGGCTTNDNPSCRLPSGSPSRTGGLSRQQSDAMEWVQRNYKVYDYCRDPQRDRTHTPKF
ncbi:hypothetical protein R3W88_016279 [Solanum pinnatisectum]|uniref:Xyloglucan endotransglucosylase/hydrolase n=1 Tax=Solanum pinnatisectum TaxID=50273 RepID=A0AAV9KWY3_9SOLN|nr:hypothetical protein R3W88_016279 [Solanum pinnatisectum]